jgi:hypothetical protein
MPPTLAEAKCQQRGRDFAELFRYQYVFARARGLSFPGWGARHVGGWTLHHGAALGVTDIEDVAGRKVGLLAGVALSADSRLVAGRLRLPLGAEDTGFVAAAEGILTSLAGRYVAFLVVPGAARAYADPVGDMGLVYDPETGALGSTPGVVLRRGLRANPAFELRRVLRGDVQFSLGHTADAVVRRLIPNHYLDLGDFTLHRHWPPRDMGFDIPEAAVPETVDAITARLGAHFRALVSNLPCVVPLTGGRDSRILISCGMADLDQVAEFSAFRFHNASRVDSRMGRDLAASMGLFFRQYFKVAASWTQKRDFRLKSGYSGQRGEFRAIAMVESFPRDHVVLRGNILELLRANQWRADRVNRPFKLLHGLRRIFVVPRPLERAAIDVWGPAYMAWREGLPENARPRTYDFGFVELLLPNTQGAFFAGYHGCFPLNPFNDRKLIGLAIGLPVEMRRRNAIVETVFRRTNPWLLDVPFH